jgi:hypothetical protein
MKLQYALFTLAVLGMSAAAHAETMRCGKWVVSEDTDPQELLAKCGQPTSQRSETSEVRRPSARGSGTFVAGTTTTEYWYYDRGPSSFRMVVIVVDGKIKSIDRAK